MKTVSVKEVAQALGCTTRTVINKLMSGKLNGQQFQNPYGVMEWRVYPTKEIAQKLKIKDPGTPESISQEITFGALEEPVEAEVIPEETESETGNYQDWIDSERQHMRVLAEEMMRPLLETIRNQERQIEDQSARLKLLPDFEKQAETERKVAQAKAFEAEALRKQVEALNLKNAEAKEAQEQIAILEQTLEEKQREAEAEIEKVKAEKELQLQAVQEQLTSLAQTVQELKKPWWKKMFSAGPEPTAEQSATEPDSKE